MHNAPRRCGSVASIQPRTMTTRILAVLQELFDLCTGPGPAVKQREMYHMNDTETLLEQWVPAALQACRRLWKPMTARSISISGSIRARR